MAKKERVSKFAGKTSHNAETRSGSNSDFSYVKLPQGIKAFSPKPGSTTEFDIIPYIVTDKNHMDKDEEHEIAVEGTEWYKKPFKVHKNVGADEITYVCPTTFGKPCPICEYKKKRTANGASYDEIKQYAPSHRVLYVLIPHGLEGFKKGEFAIFDFSFHLFQKKLNEEMKYAKKYAGFPDLEGGYRLKIRWETGKLGKFEFASCGRIDFEEREDLNIDLEEVPNLDKCLKVLSYDELNTIFLQLDHEGIQKDDEEEDEPKPKKKVKEEEENPFEDDEPKPKKKKPVVEEEEEEEAPKPKKKAKSEPTEDEIKDMDAGELIEVISHYDLDIDADEFEEEALLKNEVLKAMGYEVVKPKKKKPVVEEEEEEDEPKPKKKKVVVEEEEEEETPKPKKKSSKDECPHGLQFGVDTDSKPKFCNNCDLWEKCIEVKEG